MAVAALMKVTTRVAKYSYVNKIVSTATIAKYKLQVAYSEPSIITVVKIIGLAIKPSQTKVATRSVEP